MVEGSSFGSRAIKMLFWKACSNMLPTKDNLFQRGIVEYPLYSICGIAPETIGHIVWSCTTAHDVWTKNSRMLQTCSNDKEAFLQIFGKLCERLDDIGLQRFVFVTCQIWFRQNKVIFEGEFLPPAEVNRIANVQLENFTEAEQVLRRKEPNVVVHEVIGWRKPLVVVIKITRDASTNKNGGRMGVGAVARDLGEVVGAICTTRVDITSWIRQRLKP
jgi:hypothetical protein